MASRKKVRAIARGKAKKYGIDQDIFEALVRQESGFRERVGSPAGAQGAGQLMPATARALGVRNVNDARDNLDGAARYLKQQLKTFGGDYRKALAAYNAGPGAVQKHGGVPPYAETQNYVRAILGNRNPKDRKGGGSVRNGGGSTNVTIPGVDRSGMRDKILAQYLLTLQGQQEDPDDDPYGLNQQGALLNTLVALKQAQDTPGTKVKIPGRRGGGGGGTPSGNAASLKELFYNGPGGVNADNGRRVGRGFVSGHTDHVHAAFSSPKQAIKWGKVAQRLGLSVREQSRFDRVDPVHTKGSFHYSDRAIDVSGSPRLMAKFSRMIAKAHGI